MHGFLEYELSYLKLNKRVTGENGSANESEPMFLNYNPGSNIAVPLFSPNSIDAQIVGFNGNNNMYIPTTGDDTVVPLDATAEVYQYTTLAWLLGSESAPQNPSCVKVDVKRVFV